MRYWPGLHDRLRAGALRASWRVEVYTTSTVGVPPRPRRRAPRAGARPGDLSPQLRDALRDEAARLGDIEDPVTAARAVGDAFAALDTELERLARVRLAAVRALRREGWSYARIAAATGVSKGRVAQLVRDPRAPRRPGG